MGKILRPYQDTPLSSEGSCKFDQFGSIQEEMHRDPDVLIAEVVNRVSSSPGYQSQSGACSGG